MVRDKRFMEMQHGTFKQSFLVAVEKQIFNLKSSLLLLVLQIIIVVVHILHFFSCFLK